MDDFVACSSRWRQALPGFLSFGFVAPGLLFTGLIGSLGLDRPTPIWIPVVGWAAICFFGLMGPLWFIRMFGASEQLRIGRDGIRSAPWSSQTIAWHEIAAVTVWGTAGQRNLILHLRDPARFPGKGLAGLLAGARRRLSGGDVGISLTGTDRRFDEALGAIQRYGSSR